MFGPLSASSAVRDRPRFTGKTAWARSLPTPLRSFLRTETGSAAVLLAAAAAALVWVNVDPRTYDGVWSTEEAKLGVLSAGLAATASTWLLFRITAHLPPWLRWRALLGSDEPLTDLYPDVDPAHDHIRGPIDAPVTVVEYGDFDCPYCGRAEPVLRELLRDFTNVRYVWRHLPLTDVHVHAQLAAEAAEAACRHYGAYDIDTLSAAVRAAGARAMLART